MFIMGFFMSRKRVLLLEDMLEIQALIKRTVMQIPNLEVSTFVSAEVAIEAYLARGHEILILDNQVVGLMTGLDMMKELTQLGNQPDLVICTSSDKSLAGYVGEFFDVYTGKHPQKIRETIENYI